MAAARPPLPLLLLAALAAAAAGAPEHPGIFSDFVDLLRGGASVEAGAAISLERLFHKMQDARECLHVLPALAERLLEELKLHYFYGPGPSERVVVALADARRLPNHARWRADRPAAVYASGWLHSPSVSYSREVVKAFHANGSYNLLVADWSGVAHLEYALAVSLVPRVGRALGAALDALAAAGGELALVVGHSLGAHVAGHLARSLRVPPPLLLALDPAGPLFYASMHGCQQPVTAGDARRVVALHTDWGRLGANEPTGSADFMANGGHRLQPGCSALDTDSFGPLCSHTRAIFLFCDFLRDPASLVGRRCDSSSSFRKGRCAANPARGFADDAPESGLYYLTTDNRSPYGRGMGGI